MKVIASAMLAALLIAGSAAAQEKKAGKGKAGDPAKGKETFEQCAACHEIASADKKVGPSLKGLFKKAKLHNGKPANEANIRAIINKGDDQMPAYADLLSDDEKNDLIAYLKTI